MSVDMIFFNIKQALYQILFLLEALAENWKFLLSIYQYLLILSSAGSPILPILGHPKNFPKGSMIRQVDVLPLVPVTKFSTAVELNKFLYIGRYFNIKLRGIRKPSYGQLIYQDLGRLLISF